MGLLQPDKQRDIKPIFHRTKPFDACHVANIHHMGKNSVKLILHVLLLFYRPTLPVYVWTY